MRHEISPAPWVTEQTRHALTHGACGKVGVQEHRAANSDRPQILCVDDEPEVLAGLKTMLSCRYEVETAASGEEGLEALAQGGPFVAIVSDMRMPGMSGASFLKQARVSSPDSIPILLTGYADLDAAVEAVNQAQIFQYLNKPCPADLLLETLDRAVERYLLVTGETMVLEDKLAEMADQLIRAERLATLGTLAAGVGHELKNVSTSLMCHVPLIEQSVESGQPVDPVHLAEIRRMADHLKVHGQHLQDLGRPDGDVETIDLREVGEHMVRMLQTSGPLRLVKVNFRCDEEPVLVCAARTRVEQVLVNLISNATDAMRDGQTRQRTLDVSIMRQGKHARCVVKDNGPGMSPEVLERIFEPYFTTKPSHQGTGMGLPVVKQIVESCGGDIRVKSRPRTGAAVIFDLPLIHPDSNDRR